jgi:hypothetical protein
MFLISGQDKEIFLPGHIFLFAQVANQIKGQPLLTDPHWWTGPALSTSLGFFFGLVSGLLLEPIKIRMSASSMRDGIRVMLYQDIGQFLALTYRMRAKLKDNNELQLSDQEVLAIYGSLTTKMLAFARDSKPEVYYSLPFEERIVIERCYGEIEAWLRATFKSRAEVQNGAKRIEALILSNKKALTEEMIDKYEVAAAKAWAGAVYDDFLLTVVEKNRDYDVRDLGKR